MDTNCPYHKTERERRITLRLLAYWEKLRDGRTMPSEADIDPDHISDLWDNCFLIHVTDIEKPDYNFTYIGSEIIDAYRGHLTPDHAGELVGLNANKLIKSFSLIQESQKPLLDEGEFRNLDYEIVKYRQCLLPIGEEGQVQAIFGGMRYKVLSGSATKEMS